MIEKRQYPRIEGILPLKLSGCESDIVTETQNISGNGAYCAVSSAIAPMTKLEMVLFIPCKKNGSKTVRKVCCKGIVVRSDYAKNDGKHNHYIGIYFSEIKESDRKSIVSYINSLLKVPNGVNNVF